MQKPIPAPSPHNLEFIESLYSDFLDDPNSVDPEWRAWFEGLAEDNGKRKPRVGPSFVAEGLFAARPPHQTNGHLKQREAEVATLQHRVDQLIRNYRVRGHIIARIEPLGMPRPNPPELDPAHYGMTEADLDRPFSTVTMAGPNVRTLRTILEQLQNTYCRSIGVQFMHIDDLGVREWLQERMEGTQNRLRLTRKEQLRILTRLTDAVIFEEFIRKKYTGAKSFSLEGAESLIPLLDLAIEKAGDLGCDEIVLGMAHRGRLNVLANIMGKSAKEIFREFDDSDPDILGSHGDVKYHLGYSTEWMTSSGHSVHLSLCFNPSHLEYVNPVALGRKRAKQDRVKDHAHDRGMVFLIHGDAAFAGEGIVQETLNMSQLEGYETGGTIHILINNQMGFTTPPSQGRSMTYATSVAKMLHIPIFHVNGEDPEAVAQVVHLALEYRKTFKRDVVIDMYGYRRHGHNEGDEPSFTQPVLYRAIEKRPSVREGYLNHLLKLGGVTREEANRIAEVRYRHLDMELSVARNPEFVRQRQPFVGIWQGYFGGKEDLATNVPTGVQKEELSELLLKQTVVPEGFNVHPKLVRWLEHRREMAQGKRPLDWSAAESLAFASLAVEGHPVRLSGQDSERGTFSHRHSVLHDYEDGHSWCPLQHLSPDQSPVWIYNSPLSEAGVLGFDYGYSLDCPDGLVLWEAQFGDFCNAAQVIIDQFIICGEGKWNRLSGITLLLPHGFEGQGPEHSSARLERFLALAADYNIQIVNPTTPAQYFHVLRRQVLRKWRKPLIVMTPKGLLRHPSVISSLEDLENGQFYRVLPDEWPEERPVSRILLCSGKIYYELAEERERTRRSDVAILRQEQLYPLLPEEVLAPALEKYPEKTPVIWVQEEPENMGAWRFLRSRFGDLLFGKFPFMGIHRPVSPSTATGSPNRHKLEQRQVICNAFADLG
ncbi:MAG: 2-oxoglutarate dehydrogenase E1 component [Candidatus Omnitrophica bacterium]|nr:2-oxoglutarate dehydrogenase E1 component [Candidatus Omnitrophota bacterium]